MRDADPNRVLVLINPNSGLGVSLRALLDTFQEAWDGEGRTVAYQMSKDAEDGRKKVVTALEDGVGTLIVVGGDGMINTLASQLLDSDVRFGVVPTGSGNGFARHFNIPLNPAKAIRTLARAHPLRIDVGTANGRPFFVTCSLAWDAAIVRSFERSPVRGVLPYVFAAAYELFDYRAERFVLEIDGEPPLDIDKPMLFTIANLTQYGGGAIIAPRAKADDGYLWLTYACRSQVSRLIPQLPQLFMGNVDRVKGIEVKKVHRCRVVRETSQPIQVDGELVDSPAAVDLAIRPRALNVLVPRTSRFRDFEEGFRGLVSRHRVDIHPLRVAPQFFQRVEFPQFRGHDMHHHVPEIDHHPAAGRVPGFSRALDLLPFPRQVDLFRQRTQMRRASARDHHEIIRDRGHVAHVENIDLFAQALPERLHGDHQRLRKDGLHWAAFTRFLPPWQARVP